MRWFAAALSLAPMPALAVLEGNPAPSPPSETTTVCAEGLVWDLATERCLPPAESSNDDQAMLEDARRLAHDGRYGDALAVLDLLDAGDPLVLTYRGFATRKLGDVAGGLRLYQAALDADPDLLIARSYRGMAWLEAGDLVAALGELREIEARGGRGGWPHQALETAIRTGIPVGY